MSKLAAARQGAHAPPSAEARTPSFVDITSASQADFKHESGHTSRKYLIETTGAGVTILDYDGDRQQDLFLVTARRYWNRKQFEDIPANHILSVRGTAGCEACVPEQR
jgi:hypothetical protein